jgi:hypothetical protein
VRNEREESVKAGGFGFCSFSGLKKTVKAVACFLDRCKWALGTGWIRKRVAAVKNGDGTCKRRRFDLISSSGFDPNQLSGVGGQSEVYNECLWHMGNGRTEGVIRQNKP